MPTQKRMLLNPYVQDINGNRDQINDFFNSKNNKYIWMQYTGLIDKNDKEIYEGDILKRDNCESDIQEVIFYNGMFGWWDFDWNSSSPERTDFTVISGWEPSIRLEIVGNVHENLELILRKRLMYGGGELHYTNQYPRSFVFKNDKDNE